MYLLFRLFAEEIIACELTRVEANIFFELLPVLKYVSPVCERIILVNILPASSPASLPVLALPVMAELGELIVHELKQRAPCRAFLCWGRGETRDGNG